MTPESYRRALDLIAGGEREKGLDRVFREIDDLLCAGGYALIDGFLIWIDVDSAPVVVLVAILTATCSARTRLRERPGFFVRVHDRVLHTDPERIRGLLGGLE